MNVVPLFHMHGQITNLLSSLVSGASMIATPGFEHGPEAVFEWMARCQPTWYSAVPTIHLKLLQYGQTLEATHATGAKSPYSLRLIRNSSAFLLPSIARAIEEFFGVVVLTTYAMSEADPIASNPRNIKDRQLNSVGFAAGPSVRVCRWDDGSVCNVGEHGEVCVHGENVISGYEHRDRNGGEFRSQPT